MTSGRLLRLPFHNGLSVEDTDRVVDALVRALTQKGGPVVGLTQSGSSSIRERSTGGTAPAPSSWRRHSGTSSDPPRRLLDVGSADGPSVSWMRGRPRAVRDRPGPPWPHARDGRRASALALPFGTGTFDVVGAFDVIEHCEPEEQALAELARRLAPGGRLLASVPAYQWAWSDHDVRAGHYRRYTLPRLVGGRRGRRADRAPLDVRVHGGLPVVRGRAGGPPAAARPGRGRRRAGLPRVPRTLDRVLTGLSSVEARALRRRDLPFGSSVFLAAEKPRA